MGWIQYLFEWDRRPRIPTHLVTPFDIGAVSADELLVFKAGKARDRHYIERLMRKYKARNARELLLRIPRQRRPSIQKRIRALIMRWEGSLPYDPIRRELRGMASEGKAAASGIRRNQLKGVYRRQGGP